MILDSLSLISEVEQNQLSNLRKGKKTTITAIIDISNFQK